MTRRLLTDPPPSPPRHLTPRRAGALVVKAFLEGGPPRPVRPQTYEAFTDPRNPYGFAYWRLHGVNYLTAGPAWDPLLPELYLTGDPGKKQLAWAFHSFHQRLFKRYFPPEGPFDLVGRAALLWWFLREEPMFSLMWEARAAVRAPLRKAGLPVPDTNAPGVKALYEAFVPVGKALVRAFPEWDEHVPGERVVPSRFFRGYGERASRELKYDQWRAKGVEFYPDGGVNFWPKR